jgi:CRP-like cAMP-binding protein
MGGAGKRSESATEKLARLILKWCRDYGGRTTGGIRLQILLTHEEIAQIIGASRETVTRLFTVRKREQSIGIREGQWLFATARLSPPWPRCLLGV